MRRRDLIGALGGATLVSSHAARAQQPAMPVIGLLGGSSHEASAPLLVAFHNGLKESGYVVGRNVAIEYRWAEGRYERLPALASELVALNVAVIAAPSTPAALAAKQATQTIPIAFFSSDPVELGLVVSFSRPGGNATGVNVMTPKLIPKRLELLRDFIPNARSVTFLANPGIATAASQLRDVQAAARLLGFDLRVLEARTADDIERAFVSLDERRPDALLVAADALFSAQRAQIVALAARHAIPAVYEWPEYAAAGGLISYGPNLKDVVRMVGVYTGKILAGAKPADLPVQQPTKFVLVINLKTAKALGLTVPPSLVDRADEVIE